MVITEERDNAGVIVRKTVTAGDGRTASVTTKYDGVDSVAEVFPGTVFGEKEVEAFEDIFRALRYHINESHRALEAAMKGGQ